MSITRNQSTICAFKMIDAISVCDGCEEFNLAFKGLPSMLDMTTDTTSNGDVFDEYYA